MTLPRQIPSFRLATCQSSALATRVHNAKQVLQDAVARFGLEQISLSFNGGKDSVVLLWLLCDAIGLARARKVYTFTFSEAEPFPELEHFIKDITHRSGVDLHVLPCKSHREGLKEVAGTASIFVYPIDPRNAQ